MELNIELRLVGGHYFRHDQKRESFSLFFHYLRHSYQYTLRIGSKGEPLRRLRFLGLKASCRKLRQKARELPHVYLSSPASLSYFLSYTRLASMACLAG